MMENELFNLALITNGMDKLATFIVQHPQNYIYEVNPLPYHYGFNGLIALTLISFFAFFFLKWLYRRYIPKPRTRIILLCVMNVICLAGFLSNVMVLTIL